MKYKSLYLIGLIAACLVFAGVIFAQRANNIDPATHPSLAEASQHIQEATKKIHEAHQTDKSDLGGHAEKAIQRQPNPDWIRGAGTAAIPALESPCCCP